MEERDRPRVEDGDAYCLPVVEAASSFRPSMYRSPLMPKENKPLEVGILRRAKELLAEVDPCTAAKHITKADCTVAVYAHTLFFQPPPEEIVVKITFCLFSRWPEFCK